LTEKKEQTKPALVVQKSLWPQFRTVKQV